MFQTVISQPEPEAIAEIFWRAFNALSGVEQQAVLKRLREAYKPQPATITSLSKLRGLVAWGGDALVDSERLYDL